MAETSRIVSWNITDRCNYACAYCAQGRRHEARPAAGVVVRISDFLAQLGPGWEVKISGGEPFIEKDLFPAVKRLAASGQAVSIVTNFSFPERVYEEFIRTAGDRLRVLCVSMHLAYVTPDAFLQKCLGIKKNLSLSPKAKLTRISHIFK